MAPKTQRRKLRLAVIDRSGLAGEFESIARDKGWSVDVMSCSSALEIIGESGPQGVGGLAASVTACGPFLTDVLRWTENQVQGRVPTILVGSGAGEDAAAARMILSREHVRWCEPSARGAELPNWLLMAIEVHELRAFRREHDACAGSLREARMQLFHGFVTSYTPPDGPPCGPPLPTNAEEIQALRDARAQFERSHIQAAVREWGSLKDASAALGISYTSLWRRLR